MVETNLNLDILVKTLQSISSQMDQSRLLVNAMQAVMVHTGAQHGYVLLNISGTWQMMVKAEANDGEVEISLPPFDRKTNLYSQALIHFANRVNERLIMEDAVKEGLFARDPYLAQVRSLLCLPMESNNQLAGRLYLGHSLIPGLFTPEKVQFVEILLSQLVISLENVRRYEAFREGAIHYRRIVDTARDGIWVIGPDEKTTFVNARMAEILGYSIEEMVGKPLRAFIHPDEEADHIQKMEARRQGISESYERRFRSKAGRTIWTLASATSLFDDEHHFTGSFAMINDITERKQAEEELSLLTFALENIKEAVFLIDQEGRFQFVNQAACQSLGYTQEELLQLGVPEIDPQYPMERWDSEWESLKLQHSLTFETVHHAKDGHTFPVEINTNYLEYKGERYYLSLAHDITERKRSEEVLRQINRELRAVSNCNKALLRAVDEPSLLNEICRIIHENAGYRFVWVGYAENDEEKTICPISWAGFEDGYLTNAKITWSNSTPYGRGPAGTAIREGKVVYIQDFTSDPQFSPWRESALQRGYRSTIALPLKDETDHPFGMIGIYSAEANAITPEEIRLLEELAGDLAFGIIALRTRAERRAAEEASLESERKYKQIFDNVMDGIFLLDVTEDGHFRTIEVNPALERITGIPRSFSVGKIQEEIASEETARAVNEKYHKCVEARIPVEGEVDLDLPTGRHTFHSSLIPTIDETGRVRRIIGISRDITETRRAEQERQAHLRYLEIMDRINRAIQEANDLEQMMRDVLDTTLAVFDCDRAWLVDPLEPGALTWKLITERTRPEYIGALASSAEIPANPHLIQFLCSAENLSRVVQSVSGAEYHVPKELEEKYQIRSQLLMGIFPKIDQPYLFGLHQCSHPRIWTLEEETLFREIGQRMGDALTSFLMNRSLQDSVLRYREVFENTSDVMIVSEVTEDGRFRLLDVNLAWEKMTGFQRSAVIGHFLEDFTDFSSRKLLEHYQECLQKKEPISYEDAFDIPSGHWIVHTSLIPVSNAAGNIYRFISVSRDITEQKRAEAVVNQLTQELEQRVIERTTQLESANQELEAFAYSVSHDLRAPLRHIDGFLELLQKRITPLLDEKSRHYMKIIADSAKQMGLLIDDLLSFSRMGRNEMSKTCVEMGGLLQEVIREMEPETRGRNIDWQIADLPAVTGDRAMLKVVLVNLLSNALKFTGPREQAKIEIGCGAGAQGETVVFVRDNGVGFDMRYADKLFGVFQRLHREDEFEGTGIGLANIRRIIARHRGRTWAEGEVNQGATFYFSLPRPEP